MIGAVIFNFSTIAVVSLKRELRIVSHNLLILNLAIADSGIVFASMVFSMISIFDRGHLLRSNTPLCKVGLIDFEMLVWFAFFYNRNKKKIIIISTF